ncbi:Endonuclease/exonuclease/phosphatase [Mrakia frigida]|uniref:Endonuclease/exonuclease/phosphatase n=1 Tax=Mrakia frigida TaxID=29902 RepID=UPI003FCC25AC
MLVPLSSLLLVAIASTPLASAITISPVAKGSNAERLSRGLAPLKPSRTWRSRASVNNKRQAAAPLPSSGVTLSPHDIQGPTFLSSYDGQNVTNLQGVVTAKTSSGFYIQSVVPDTDDRTSEGLYVYSYSVGSQVAVGDIITLSGLVAEYSSDSTGLHLTELTLPKDIVVLSSNNVVTPLVLGVDRTPPGSAIFFEDQFQLPSQTVNIEETVTSLEPASRGLDFWESLEGMLVTIPNPRAVSRTNSYKETWIVGEAYATGSNAQGGLNLMKDVNGNWDANPEAIWVWSPLDGTSNPAVSTTVIGTKYETITGIISYTYGFPVIYPLTAPKIISSPSTALVASTIIGDGQCKVSMANYNVLNLNTGSRTFAKLADHITTYLNLPDVIGLEEIQDNTGAANDGVTEATEVLAKLVDAIKTASGVTYTAMEIAPVDLMDGGAPGGNIRPAVLYRSDRLELDTFSPTVGTNQQSQSFVSDPTTGETTFALTPGLIDPTNVAWTDSRKPISVSFLVKGSTSLRKRLHVIVAHFASKSGSGPTEGRFQTADNGAVGARIQQAQIVADFVAEMLSRDPEAHLALLGDLNEFSGVQPLDILSTVLTELHGNLAPEERYSYQFDQNTQQIDHILTVPSLAVGSSFEIPHLNTHGLASVQASDHDPVVASVVVC